VLVKDESSRLGLPAFKVLGASWACRQVLARRPGATLVTATDGNHGRAVARMAAHFGVEATVFVPGVLLPEAAARVAGEGAQVVWVDGDYDAAVRRAAEFAGAQPGRALVQDTARDGYEQVPVVRHYRRPGAAHPRVLLAEPDTAACVLASLTAGRPVTVPTAGTVMAGLNCGTVSGSAWPVLRAGCDAAVAVSDDDALRAAGDLGWLGVSSGPSGAAALDLGDDAVVVLLSTEGRTQ
jgi:diaminopropionate ammonia-lyase